MQRGALCALVFVPQLVILNVVQVHSVQLYSNAAGVEPTSPCAKAARSQDLNTCLQAIRRRAEDSSVFWFGNSYSSRCGQEERLQADCYNPLAHRGPHSVMSRISSMEELGPRILDRYLEVTYATRPGSYKGCENQFTYNHSREVTLDPLSMKVMTPYEVRAPPKVWWPTEEDTLYTLLFYDVGYLTMKALHVNIPASNLTEGQTVVDYEGPLNPTRNNNPYVFLLFRQTGPLTLSDHWVQVLNKRTLEAELWNFTQAQNLKGPIALNWVLVAGDAYAAEVSRIRGDMNTCAHFVARAFQAEDIKFIPNKTYYGHALTQVNVFVNVTFEATPIVVNSCCSLHRFPARTFNLNPIGSAMVLPAHARNDAIIYVTLHMATAFPDNQRDFKDKTLTLLMADGDVPYESFGNSRLPYVHWLVINIRDGDVASGDVVQTYTGPAPPDPNPHRYYFLLFLQSYDLDPRQVDYSAVNCSWDFRGRCRFDVMSMVSETDLTLIGVTWMLSQHDHFVRQLYVQGGLIPRCAACHGEPGYADPCPSRASSPPWATWSAGMGVLVLCFGAVLWWSVLSG